jgi:hypothetical protein
MMEKKISHLTRYAEPYHYNGEKSPEPLVKFEDSGLFIANIKSCLFGQMQCGQLHFMI